MNEVLEPNIFEAITPKLLALRKFGLHCISLVPRRSVIGGGGGGGGGEQG